MNWSLAIGFGMLIGKTTAYWLTASTAILSDAAESIIHIIGVGFAAAALRLAARPATDRYLYGYERVSFFSAGFEGGLIAFAGVGILVEAGRQLIHGTEIRRLGVGTLIILAASVINLILGWYLVRVGRREHSIILEANGSHVLSDSWTSFGVLAGLALVMLTGWKPFDPICAALVALNLLWSGGNLVRRSIRGLLDWADPGVARELDEILQRHTAEYGIQYHRVQFRSTGRRLIGSVHLLFPSGMSIGEAHRIATEIEDRIANEMRLPVEITTHLESTEDHAQVHRQRQQQG